MNAHDALWLVGLTVAGIGWWAIHVRALFRLWAREDKEREGN
jgi:hypothetical protein